MGGMSIIKEILDDKERDGKPNHVANTVRK
jgi:hypothetical protein